MSRSTLAVVVFLALLAVAAGLYASGPKQVWECRSGESWAMSTSGTMACFRQDDSLDRHGRQRRRANAWERIKFSIVGGPSAQ
jgi:hypothetical protein